MKRYIAEKITMRNEKQNQNIFDNIKRPKHCESHYLFAHHLGVIHVRMRSHQMNRLERRQLRLISTNGFL